MTYGNQTITNVSASRATKTPLRMLAALLFVMIAGKPTITDISHHPHLHRTTSGRLRSDPERLDLG